MDTLSFKTVSASEKIVKRAWHVVDAENQVVGRLASRIAHILRGKNKPYFTPHFDTGDYVIVLNTDKVRFTGSKTEDKQYVRHTGYPGGQRFTSPKQLLAGGKSDRILQHAVAKMLPKTKLGKAMIKKLFLYSGNEHPHAAQKPVSVNLLNK